MSDYEEFCKRTLLLAEVYEMSPDDIYSKIKEEFDGVTLEDVGRICSQLAWIKYLSNVRKKVSSRTAERMLRTVFEPSDPTAKDRIKRKLPEWLYGKSKKEA